MKVGILSGYFNPIHPGHISMMEDFKKRVDHLVVIVNNDKQVKLKDSIPFLDEEARINIVESIKYVDETILSVDETLDITVTLTYLILSFPSDLLFFGNGGDRNNSTTSVAEEKLCRDNDVELIYGLGDSKKYSSSELIEAAFRYKIDEISTHN